MQIKYLILKGTVSMHIRLITKVAFKLKGLMESKEVHKDRFNRSKSQMGTSIKWLRIRKLRQSKTQSLQVRRKDRKMVVKFNLLPLKKAKNLSTEQLRAVQLAIHQPTVITEAEKNKIVNSLLSMIRTLFIKT